MLVPCPSKLQVGQVSGTALPSTYSVAGTQGHSVTTKLKLRVRGEERFSSVCCWGPWHTSWDLCSRQGPFGMKEQQEGADGYRAETSRDNVQTRGCPCSAPLGLNWLMGIGCRRRSCPMWSVPVPLFAEGALEGRVRGREEFLEAPAHQ